MINLIGGAYVILVSLCSRHKRRRGRESEKEGGKGRICPISLPLSGSPPPPSLPHLRLLLRLDTGVTFILVRSHLSSVWWLCISFHGTGSESRISTSHTSASSLRLLYQIEIPILVSCKCSMTVPITFL